MTKIKWGQVMTMSDGTIITYRMRSSSKDHTPVVELQVHNMPGVRSQKTHFIPRGRMSGVNKTINADGMRVLRDIVDEAIVSLEAVIVARDNVAWGVVRLNTTLGPVEVRNRIEELPINDEGETGEFGVLSVMVSNGAFVVDDVDQEASVCSLDEMVTGITLINGRVVTYEDGEAIADRSYTQAIVFELASGEYLVLDKGAWFSEMITINMGPEPSVFISDDSEDWEDDPEEPSIHYGWERAFVRV